MTFSDLLLLDGGHYFKQQVGNDIVSPNLVNVIRWFSLPVWVRRMIARMYGMLGHKKLGAYLGTQMKFDGVAK